MLEKTQKVLDILCHDDLFKNHDIRFVGGTALSYYLEHRLSEDLDFTMLEFNYKVINDTMLKYSAVRINNNLNEDVAINDGFYASDCYVTYKLNDVKIDFFEAPLNVMENEIWNEDNIEYYNNTNLKMLSLKSVLYMKILAFWSRKKYRDLFDIYYVLKNNYITTEEFLNKYLKYNITYTLENLYEKISSKNEFFEKDGDEGLSTLVDNPYPYEWYRNEIEKLIHKELLKELYTI